MFKSIFDIRGAAAKGKKAKTHGRGATVTPSRAARGVSHPAEPAPASLPDIDLPIDESMLAVGRELAGLAQIEVSRAAKERGWASLQRELERRPVRARAAAAGRPAKTGAAGAGGGRMGQGRGRRWALGSVAAGVAVVATLLGTWGAGVLQTADEGTQPTTISVVSSDSTEPVTTVTENTTVSTETSTSTDGQPTTTENTTVSTEVQPTTTENTPVTTSGTGTSQGGTGTTAPVNTSTTRPPSPTTTGEQQNAAAQRAGSARAVAIDLADCVITGNTTGATALVAPGAQAALAQMIMSLNEPYGYTDVKTQALTGNYVRVTLGINDRVVGSNGELVETIKRFAIKVLVNDDGAVVTAINGL